MPTAPAGSKAAAPAAAAVFKNERRFIDSLLRGWFLISGKGFRLEFRGIDDEAFVRPLSHHTGGIPRCYAEDQSAAIDLDQF